MADSAPKVAEKERREPQNVVDGKAQELVDEIKRSKHFIAFTGAGISTSAGIPDFRGPEGAWTLRAQGRQRTGKTTSTLQAIPTKTHMALVELQNRGILKYLVSQNCDGLHRKSGILPDRISELHGNSNREYCKDCGKEYLRDFRAVASYEKTVRDHRTGRKCAICGGTLLDTIINFGEYLFAEPLQRARDNAKKADLCLALGSSLTVPPACTIPESVGEKKRSRANPEGGLLVICNLQSTPLDHLSTGLRVWATTDDLMERVMEKLGLQIPEFVLRRRLVVELEAVGDERFQVEVRGVDVDGTPATFLQSVKMEGSRRWARAEPFVIGFRREPGDEMDVKLELEFMGHYGEPNLKIVQEYAGEGMLEVMYLLEYNPSNGEWNVSKLDGELPVEGGGGTERDEEREDSLMISAEEAGVPSHVVPSSAASEIIDLTSSP
ncbi:NAD-dependent deacetylase sirtuin-7 [Colletotrichum higginsianum IMI 349063]|uniref:protein acetyllysine N-acetyltransferase n=1 Tax=Colletotrichum higginsianum (strain IMI 349063) TaxID=759273 RepID=A0A1B7XXT9_COLHI|nr:NAD-dependent deacetylase sirtuin-7 [Colletotrichum higginsianum IMI 349063]OBR04587.1 NAD-dependent deacetylase sirtuin-7 [Colletotrichum higginsianum IMI 349063]